MEPTKDEKKALKQEEWREKAEKEQKIKLYRTIAFWSFGGILVILTIWALTAISGGNPTTTSSPKIPAVTSADFQTGSESAKITLIEYADFQCPACKAYFPLVKRLQADYGNKLRVVYRFFPLKTIHQNALSSARAAYAAGKQGKFWEMHDKLFENQANWSTLSNPETVFIGYAKDIGLETTQFKKEYESNAAIAFVNTSYEVAVTLGLNATPTFFLNGKQITNPQSYQDFKTLIDKQ